GLYDFYPPTTVCLSPHCIYIQGPRAGAQLNLGRSISTNVVFYTRDLGPVPAVCHSAKCDHCGVRYYPNYFVDPTTEARSFYEGLPSAIHVTTHVFVELSLCIRFANAAAYILKRFPAGWSIDPTLTSVLVGDAFFIHGLLRDKDGRRGTLVLHSQGNQAMRLDPALQERTALLVGPAREAWNHLCDKCCAARTVNGQHGKPCCNFHDCQEPLSSQRDRYCEKHKYLSSICVVVGCDLPAPSPHQTCMEPSHRALEDPSGRSALFVLQRRLERLRAASLEDHGDGITDELIDIDADGECPTKPDEGNTKPRARFGRRRTHNEQLVVATCGVILGRATMYGSEVIFYDTACNLKKHILNIGDHHFDRCAMPVDPFHAKTKHKETDAFCGQYCNVALFPELLDGSRWRFNSSAAEMTNAWFGGFQSIVWEMRAVRYDFFWDEMIRIRNEIIIGELQRSKANPVLVPREYLL
ncbi:uncharacterized protein TRAVEDRAFT_114826, partial [Trametes versicolor FP-101664 SS1]|uniref:uncharacterized protein n=1 Tax=Trametes versicolor (strain FP-101664) TaxID=717944 RepID=UPI000462480B